jgi:nickel-dependent lactate racemase
MRVKLAYGRSGLEVSLPDERTTVIEPAYLPGLPDEAAALRRALRQPIASPPLAERVKPTDSVVIVFCDITRPMPTRRVLPVILGELGHVPAGNITLLNATGTHRANTQAELAEMLGPEIVGRYRVVNHDARAQETLEYVGRTPRGGPVWLDRAYLAASIRIVTGFIEPHFFAGFSGGPKLVAPGVAGLETVMHLHSAPLIADPRATWGITLGNPIHDEIRAIARLAPPTFALDVALNKEHRITAVWAGDVFASHPQGCEFVKRTAMQPVPAPFDVVLTTNGGYPLDQNLYQAVKGMSAAALVVRQGGAILCAAECRDGLPEHGNYKDLLHSSRSPAEMLARIQTPGFSVPDQWEAQIQAQIQLKARVLLKNGYLSPDQVRAAHLEPVDDVEQAVARLLAEYGPSARLCVLPQGPQTIPYVADGSGPISPAV